jgi:hypothetical protein
MKTVLILAGADDEHALAVQTHLHGRGVPVALLDSRWFPGQLRLAFDPVSERWNIGLPGGAVLTGEQVGAIYWRCYNGITWPALPDPEQGQIAGNDARSLFESLLIRLPVRWVNGWRAFQLHQTKPVQLAMAARLGATVPATLLANDPAAIRDFAERHPRCIFKPVQGGAHTRPLEPRHLEPGNLASLALAPVTLQEEVPGTNIRVFVAGRRVLACEVRADTLDFRETPDPRIIRHDLPAEMERLSLELAAALDLCWTGIDFRLAPEGRYVFLEANPSPMFLGFQRRSGLPLLESLGELLASA